MPRYDSQGLSGLTLRAAISDFVPTCMTRTSFFVLDAQSFKPAIARSWPCELVRHMRLPSGMTSKISYVRSTAAYYKRIF